MKVTHRFAVAAVATLLPAGLLAGCSDDEPSGRTTDPDTSTPTSAEPSPTQTADPAFAGEVLEQPTFRVTAPTGWVVGDRLEITDDTYMYVLRPDDSANFSQVGITVSGDYPYTDVTEPTSAVLEKFRIQVPNGRLLPSSEWAGEPAFHLRGSGGLFGGYAEDFGVLRDDLEVVVGFRLVTPAYDYKMKRPEFDLGPAEIKALVTGLQASWEWL